LVTSLGPRLNVTSRIAEYPWSRIILRAVPGYIFSDRVQAIAEFLGYLVWDIPGFIATVILGRKTMHCMEG